MKKLLVYLLMLSLCLTMVLAGCSSTTDKKSSIDTSQQTEDTQDNKDTQDKDTKDDSKEKDSIVTPPGTFPVVKEKVTVKILAGRHQNTEDLATNEFTKWYEEKTNVHIEWDQVPQGQQAEKVNIVLASGDYPDAFLYAGINKAQLMLYGAQGVFIALNDYIDKYAPEIKKMFDEVEYIRQGMTAPDGNIYAIPTINECYHCAYAQKLYVYMPWLEKLGLEIPKTTEDFKNMLRAFKTQDPNGNGKADEIPLAGSPTGYGTYLDGFLMQPFEYVDGSDDYIKVENGKIEFVANTEGWKKGVQYLRDLYKEGLIAPESFTQDVAQLKQVIEDPNAPLVGATPASSPGTITIYRGESGRFMEYNPIPPLEGPDGRRETARYNYEIRPQLIITSAMEHPEILVRWADWFYTLDGSVSGHRGYEGNGWERAKEGEISYTGEPAYYRQLFPSGMQNQIWGQTGLGYNTKYIRESMVANNPNNIQSDQEYRLWKDTREYYEPYAREEILPELFYTEEQAAEITEIKAVMSDYVKASFAQFVTGERDIDKEWDNYKQELENMGLERFLQIMQEVYDANINASK